MSRLTPEEMDVLRNVYRVLSRVDARVDDPFRHEVLEARHELFELLEELGDPWAVDVRQEIVAANEYARRRGWLVVGGRK